MSGFRYTQRDNPYLGTHTERPTLSYAPDAMVYINGEHEIPVCLSCGAKAPLKQFTTSLSTSLSIDGSGGGNASLDMVIPRHDSVSFVRNGKLAISAMMEVEIWFKGAFNVFGMPRYYPAFWGYINTVSHSYSDHSHSVSISCSDMLSFWNLIKFNAKPSALGAQVAGSQNLEVWSTRFRDSNPFQILLALTMISRDDLVQVRSLFNESIQSEEYQGKFRESVDQVIRHWQNRFNKIAKSIRVYGVQGESLFNSAQFYNSKLREQKQLLKNIQHVSSNTLYGVDLDTNDKQFNPFLTFSDIQLFDSDLRGRLDVMVQVKDHIGWEFYLDTNGEIVFKPPFYNVDVRQNYPISWIRDIEVIDWGFDEGEPEATRVDVLGGRGENVQLNMDQSVELNGTFQNHHLCRQYGIRMEEVQAHWLKTGKACGIYAADQCSKHDANRHTGSVTIPMRPELRLGMPVYIESVDCFYYVTSISHSFAPGSSATTTLGLRARREKFSSTELIYRKGALLPNGDHLNIDASGVNRDSMGKDLGIPNVIMRTASADEYRQKVAQNDVDVLGAYAGIDQEVYNPERSGGFQDIVENPLHRQLVWDEYRRGITWDVSGGLWVYDIDEDLTVTSIMWEPDDSDLPPDVQTNPSLEQGALPVSGDSGYRLVGVFPYGRGLVIDESGALVSPVGSVDQDGNPVSSGSAVAQQSVLTRNITPDDQVEVSPGVQTRSSIGPGSVSSSYLMRVDSTDSAQSYAEMSPEDSSSNMCTCKDNYTIDGLLLLQELGTYVNEAFESVSSIQDLVTDSYQVATDEVFQHEADHTRTQTGEDTGAVGSLQSGSTTPYSPSLRNDT